MPPLLAAYPGTLRPPWKLRTEATKTTRPPRPRSIILRPSSRVSRNGAVRFTSITASQSSSECSAAGARRMVPALLTSTSTASPSASSRSTRARSAAREPRSQRWAAKRRPRPRTSAPTSPPSDSSEALTPTMSAPASASRRATARPMPRRQPVTSAVRPLRSTRRPTRSQQHPPRVGHQPRMVREEARGGGPVNRAVVVAEVERRHRHGREGLAVPDRHRLGAGDPQDRQLGRVDDRG